MGSVTRVLGTAGIKAVDEPGKSGNYLLPDTTGLGVNTLGDTWRS
jgi:hypothetical protein